MQKLLKGLFLFLFLHTFCSKTFAQVNITINDIAKIHMVDGAGYLGGYFRNDYDLLHEDGQWRCYQTRERYSRMDYRERDPKKMMKKRDSAEHRFIKAIPADSISKLFKALGAVKPKFNAADLKVSIPLITKQVDTGYLKRMDKESVQLFNSFFNTPAKLNHLLDTLQHDFWTDDYPYAVLEIVKKTGDTVKVITDRQVDYMLPWKINNVPTYDLSINAFFMNATGLTDHRMSGKYLSGNLYRRVDFLYARDAFERVRWQKIAPENFKYIQQHFDIVNVSKSNDYSVFTFHPKSLKTYVVINGTLNISNKNQLVALTKFAEDTLKSFLKKGAFMMDSCAAKKGCTINFVNTYGQSLHQYFSNSNNALTTYLNKFNQKELYQFIIHAGDRIEDDWIALPNGEFVLTSHIDNYAVGVLPQYIEKNEYQRRWSVFMVFTADGKLKHREELKEW